MDRRDLFGLFLKSSFFAGSLVALFWTIWTLAGHPVPVISTIEITRNWIITLPFGISRWWDVLFVSLWASALALIITSEGLQQSSGFFALMEIGCNYIGLQVSLAVSLATGLAASLIAYLSGSLLISLIIGLSISSIYGLVIYVLFGMADVVGLTVGLAMVVMIGLITGLCLGLVAGVITSFIISLAISFFFSLGLIRIRIINI